MQENGQSQVPARTQPKLPTAYELSRLALAYRTSYPTEPDPMGSAMRLYERAEEYLSNRQTAREQLRVLRSGWCTMSKHDWEACLEGFCGFPNEKFTLFNSKLPIDCVLKGIYPGKDYSQEQRRTLIGGLIKFAADHKIAFPQTWSSDHDAQKKLELALKEPTMPLRTARWFAEARLAQKIENRKRDFILPSAGKGRTQN
jgi:hypothetical protein